MIDLSFLERKWLVGISKDINKNLPLSSPLVKGLSLEYVRGLIPLSNEVYSLDQTSYKQGWYHQNSVPYRMEIFLCPFLMILF